MSNLLSSDACMPGTKPKLVIGHFRSLVDVPGTVFMQVFRKPDPKLCETTLLALKEPIFARNSNIRFSFRYITYGSFLPRHGLSALHILIGVCQSPLVQPKIVGLFTADEVCCEN